MKSALEKSTTESIAFLTEMNIQVLRKPAVKPEAVGYSWRGLGHVSSIGSYYTSVLINSHLGEQDREVQVMRALKNYKDM